IAPGPLLCDDDRERLPWRSRLLAVVSWASDLNPIGRSADGVSDRLVPVEISRGPLLNIQELPQRRSSYS
ncbi:MAG: hypothetical protein ABEH83_06340, partial [Halobacterium sp.]